MTRTADAVAMSLYPSRGLEIHGIEIKKYRGDWLRELKKPDKSAAIQKFCDRWWIAVSDEKIVQPGELPKTWGLLVPKGAKLVVKVEAPQLECEPINRRFLASIMRNASGKAADKAEIDHAVMIEVERINAQHRELRESDRQAAQRSYFDLRQQVDAFQKASGVDIVRGWRHAEIGAAVKFILDGGLEPMRERLRTFVLQAELSAAELRRILAIPKFTPVQRDQPPDTQL